jgi:hypothetical protein
MEGMRKRKAKAVLHPYAHHSRKPVMGIDKVIGLILLQHKPLQIISEFGQMAAKPSSVEGLLRASGQVHDPQRFALNFDPLDTGMLNACENIDLGVREICQSGA